jgi:hypothetical protein
MEFSTARGCILCYFHLTTTRGGVLECLNRKRLHFVSFIFNDHKRWRIQPQEVEFPLRYTTARGWVLFYSYYTTTRGGVFGVPQSQEIAFCYFHLTTTRGGVLECLNRKRLNFRCVIQPQEVEFCFYSYYTTTRGGVSGVSQPQEVELYFFCVTPVRGGAYIFACTTARGWVSVLRIQPQEVEFCSICI